MIPLFLIIYLCGFNTCANDTTAHILYNNTDAAQTIQSAINNVGNGEIFQKAGNYYWHNTVNIPSSLKWEGEGINSTHNVLECNLTNMITKTSNIHQILIQDINFNGTNKAKNVLNLSDNSETSNQIKIVRVQVTGGINNNVIMDGNEDSLIRESEIYNQGSNTIGINWHVNGGNVWLENNYVDGDVVIQAQQATLRDMTLQHITSDGITILAMENTYFNSSPNWNNEINLTHGLQDIRISGGFFSMKQHDNFIIGSVVNDIDITDSYFSVPSGGNATLIPNPPLLTAGFYPTVKGTIHLEGISSNSGYIEQTPTNNEFTLK